MPSLTDKAASFARTETEEGTVGDGENEPEMVMRVARALAGKHGSWSAYLDDARAAIEAMREPVKDQLAAIHQKALIECRPDDRTASILNARAVWSAAIDAALGNPPVAR